LLASPFGGAVFPVNPKRTSVLGIRAYPNIASVPDPVDLAVIVTPAKTVPGVIRECVNAEVQGAIVISAGFRETGEPGAELERQVLNEARRGRMRIIGPNCLGVMSPLTGFNATFATAIARPGNVALIRARLAAPRFSIGACANRLVSAHSFLSVRCLMWVGAISSTISAMIRERAALSSTWNRWATRAHFFQRHAKWR
jgi:acetyltransferase